MKMKKFLYLTLVVMVLFTLVELISAMLLNEPVALLRSYKMVPLIVSLAVAIDRQEFSLFNGIFTFVATSIILFSTMVIEYVPFTWKEVIVQLVTALLFTLSSFFASYFVLRSSNVRHN